MYRRENGLVKSKQPHWRSRVYVRPTQCGSKNSVNLRVNGIKCFKKGKRKCRKLEVCKLKTKRWHIWLDNWSRSRYKRNFSRHQSIRHRISPRATRAPKILRATGRVTVVASHLHRWCTNKASQPIGSSRCLHNKINNNPSSRSTKIFRSMQTIDISWTPRPLRQRWLKQDKTITQECTTQSLKATCKKWLFKICQWLSKR